MNPIIKQILELYDHAKRMAKLRGEPRFVTDFENRNGYERRIIHRWQHNANGANPATVCAVANALGYRLVLEKIETE